MKIIVDDKIPYIEEKLHLLADEVVALPGAKISADDVRDADALIVRTRTRCDEQLLKDSKVQFVATISACTISSTLSSLLESRSLIASSMVRTISKAPSLASFAGYSMMGILPKACGVHVSSSSATIRKNASLV